jgi:hypothetical protein
MRKLLISAAVFSLFLMTGCAPHLTPFSRKIYENGSFSDENLKKVQFYLSDDLVLTREIENTGEVEIRGGKIKMENGRKVEIVRFEAGTPGVFIFRPQDDHFAVSFEKDDTDSSYLIFGPNPKMGNQYTLLASEWKNRRGKVTYAGQKFYTNADGAFVKLMVNMKKYRNDDYEARRAKGRKLE